SVALSARLAAPSKFMFAASWKAQTAFEIKNLAERGNRPAKHSSEARQARYCPVLRPCYISVDLGIGTRDRDRRALHGGTGAAGRHWMNDGAPPQGGLGANGAKRRPRWGRRTPYGIRRDFRDPAPEARHVAASYAALDLGTNNCRLLVARPTADGFRVVDAFSRIIRLGEGVAGSGRISEAAIARAVEALLVCREKMHLRGVERARLIATAACR